jgi:hypothetical protein
MANYTVTVNFTLKDSLPFGDPAKIIKGAEFGTEFSNISTAINSLDSDITSLESTVQGKANITNPTTAGVFTHGGTVNFTGVSDFDIGSTSSQTDFYGNVTFHKGFNVLSGFTCTFNDVDIQGDLSPVTVSTSSGESWRILTRTNGYGELTGLTGGNNGNVFAVGSGDTGLGFSSYSSFNAILPYDFTNNTVRNDVIDIGGSGAYFDNIYATNGTIITSDINTKQDIEELSEAEKRVAVVCKGLLRKYRLKSAVEKKGDAARYHFGIIAQDLKKAFEDEGLDVGRYGVFIEGSWKDEETGEVKTKLAVRYHELLAFIIAAL